MTNEMLWLWYACGAFAALLWKYICYYRINHRIGRNFLDITDEWIFEKSTENAVSWVATILVVWAAGVTLIGDVAFLWSEWIYKYPAHPAFAALAGCIMEYAAPNIFKWLLAKTPWASENKS